MEIFGLPDTPLTWGLGLFALGASAVLVAKILGLIFLRHRTVHRVGDAMNVTNAEVTEWSGKEGYVQAGGELWRAKSDDSLKPGDAVSVSSMNGLLLRVKKKA